MAALLVGMSVAAILLSAAMPVWKQMARREQEAELIFRGQQYVRAIGLFQRRAGPGVLPPSLDVLVQQRLLRKKFKDPITNDDFDLLTPAQAPAAPGQGTGRGVPSGPGQATGPAAAAQPAGRGGPTGGIMGVASRSKEASIRVYNGRTRYNEWQFVYVQQTQGAGVGRGAQPQRGATPPGVVPPPAGGMPPAGGGPPPGPPAPFGRGPSFPQR